MNHSKETETNTKEKEQEKMVRPTEVSPWKIGGIVIAAISLVLVVIIIVGGIGSNDAQDWQVVQSVGGDVVVRDEPGFYLKNFASVWTYPRVSQFECGTDNDPNNRITFNDSGNANIGFLVRIGMPRDAVLREKVHREFAHDLEKIKESIRAHIINCAKSSGPLMSSSEHQAARKSEFAQLVQDQLKHGLYEMRSVRKVLTDEMDERGEPIVVSATEVITDQNGTPKLAEVSPLIQYGFEVIQFSITRTDYDAKTLEKFDAKKDSFLKTEQAKAERQQEVQQRLMVEEKGRREKAEVEAAANMEKATAVINAQREKEVAELQARQKVAVAEQQKLEAETVASRQVEVAKLSLEEEKLIRQAAEEKAAAIRTLAQAEEERIDKGGAITEQERTLAEIAAKRDVQVAVELAKIRVPSTMIIGGSGTNGEGGSNFEHLLNLWMLRTQGIVEDQKQEEGEKNENNG